MRKWLAGWLSWAADRLYPDYSERVRRGLEPITEAEARERLTNGAAAYIRAQEALRKRGATDDPR